MTRSHHSLRANQKYIKAFRTTQKPVFPVMPLMLSIDLLVELPNAGINKVVGTSVWLLLMPGSLAWAFVPSSKSPANARETTRNLRSGIQHRSLEHVDAIKPGDKFAVDATPAIGGTIEVRVWVVLMLYPLSICFDISRRRTSVRKQAHQLAAAPGPYYRQSRPPIRTPSTQDVYSPAVLLLDGAVCDTPS